MFNRKPAAAPTIEDRIGSAAATKAAALSIFDVVVSDLHKAKDEAREIEAMVHSEIERLQGLARAAADEAIDAEIKVSNITALVG